MDKKWIVAIKPVFSANWRVWSRHESQDAAAFSGFPLCEDPTGIAIFDATAVDETIFTRFYGWQTHQDIAALYEFARTVID